MCSLLHRDESTNLIDEARTRHHLAHGRIDQEVLSVKDHTHLIEVKTTR